MLITDSREEAEVLVVIVVVVKNRGLMENKNRRCCCTRVASYKIKGSPHGKSQKANVLLYFCFIPLLSPNSFDRCSKRSVHCRYRLLLQRT